MSNVFDSINALDKAMIRLRPMTTLDIDTLFEMQRDRKSAWKSSGRRDPEDRPAYHKAQGENLERPDDEAKVYVIEYDHKVVGSVGYFRDRGELEVMYWLGEKFWGRGIATMALAQLLSIMRERFSQEAIFARVVKGNANSMRVLEKCQFKKIGDGKFYSDFLKKTMTEIIFELEPDLTAFQKFLKR